MLIFYSDDLTITGYQTFPETSNAPHIVVPDDLATNLHPVIGFAKLLDNNGTLKLPENLPELAEQKRLADLSNEARAKRDQMLTELDRIVGNPLRWASLSSEQQNAAAEYRQSLLDVPQQEGFPAKVLWPEMTIQNP